MMRWIADHPVAARWMFDHSGRISIGVGLIVSTFLLMLGPDRADGLALVVGLLVLWWLAYRAFRDIFR